MSDGDREGDLVRRIPSPAPAGDRFQRQVSLLRVLLVAASAVTAAVALWLLVVTATVLPARDPGHVAFWRMAAVGCLAFSGLSAVCLVTGPRHFLLAVALLACSAAAFALGGAEVVRTLSSGPGHFEGYLLLMGLILMEHGSAGFAYAVLTLSRSSRISST